MCSRSGSARFTVRALWGEVRGADRRYLKRGQATQNVEVSGWSRPRMMHILDYRRWAAATEVVYRHDPCAPTAQDRALGLLWWDRETGEQRWTWGTAHVERVAAGRVRLTLEQGGRELLATGPLHLGEPRFIAILHAGVVGGARLSGDHQSAWAVKPDDGTIPLFPGRRR